MNAVTETVEQTLNKAIAQHQAGQLQDAGELYLAILQTQPDHPDANHNLGALAVQMNQPAAGLAYFTTALDAEPTRRQFWLSYIDALLQADQRDDARQILALAQRQGLQGDDVDALAIHLKSSASVVAAPHAKSPPDALNSGLASPSTNEIDTLVTLFEKRQFTEAAGLAETMTQRFPSHWVGWKMLGVVFMQIGRSADALVPMQQAAMLLPNDAEAHDNLGITLQALGRFDAAEASYRTSLQINPDAAQVHSNLGSTLQALGRLDAAETCYRRALQINPQYAKAHNNLGALLQAQHRLAEAEASLRHALQLHPDYAEAHSNLGLTLSELGDPAAAEASYRRALHINPSDVDVHCKLGATLQRLGRLVEAEASYARALDLNPECADAYDSLGGILKALGKMDAAEANYRQALTIDPDNAEVHCKLGNILLELHRPAEAEISYQQSLKIKPDLAEAHNNLANTYVEFGRFDEDAACLNRALQIKPDFTDAHFNLGNTLKEMGRLVEAEACFRRALEIDPAYLHAHQNLLVLLANLSAFDQVVAQSDATLALSPNSTESWEQRLYTFSYHPDLTAAQIYAEFVRWGDRFPDPVVDFSSHNRTPGRRLRIGYVSPDFRRHTSRFFFWPLFANHDHTVVELFAYSNVKTEDDVTQQFKGLFDHWRNIRDLSNDATARMIRADHIDILVDGCNHMRDDRLAVFALKPAPLQVTWLGAAWTTGLKMMDYALIDPYMAPEGTLTRETIVRLPHSFVAYQPPETTAAIAPPPCLKNGSITFGYSGRTERLNHHTFRVWGEILRQNPTAKLILDFRPFTDPPTQAHYTQFMVKHGMNPAQVIMRNSAKIFEGLNDIDILLDCFPHSGGTMLFDALWMGVPFVTLASRPPVGRIGTTLMTNLGLSEWVANSHEEYVRKACAFSRDTLTLTQLRSSMRERMQNSPLMDGPGFARGVEAAFRKMFEQWAGSANVQQQSKAIGGIQCAQ